LLPYSERIARDPPSRPEALLAGLSPRERIDRADAEALLRALAREHEREQPFHPIPRPLEGEAREGLRQLILRVAEVARQHRLPPPLLAPRRWLEAHLRGNTPAPLRSGWRAQLLAPILG
jgi:ribonuclease D